MFRETHRSLLGVSAQQGAHPSVMQRLADHKDPNITFGIYTQVNMDQQRETMDAIQSVFT